jgi:hypothetical protein
MNDPSGINCQRCGGNPDDLDDWASGKLWTCVHCERQVCMACFDFSRDGNPDCLDCVSGKGERVGKRSKKRP